MELSLEDILIILRKRLKLVLAVSVIGGLLCGAATFFFIRPTYTATASLYVTNQQAAQDKMLSMNDLNVSQSLVATYLVIIESDTVLDKVAQQVNQEFSSDSEIQEKPLTAKTIRKMMSNTAINETEAFDIEVTNPNPVLAQRLVSSILEKAPLEIIRVVKAGAVEVIDYPTLPAEAHWPIVRNILIGVLLGVTLAVAYVLLDKMLDTVVHSEQDLTSVFNIPVLGVIPQFDYDIGKSGGGVKK